MSISDTMLGGGQFTGRAIYDTNVFSGVKEDVADLVSMISPRETPLLMELGNAEYPAFSVYHQWQEEALGPNAIINSAAVASTAADTNIAVNAVGLQKGMILRGPEVSGGEYMQIVNVPGPNTITVARAFAGTTANSFNTGEYITIVADAAVDGADVLGDLSQARPLRGNYTQIIKKDVIISGTQQAVLQHGGIVSELDHQIRNRTTEALRDLEKSLILGRLSGSTLGTNALTRTFRGLLQAIATNAVTVTSINGAMDATALVYFRDRIDAMIQGAWTQGGLDADLIVTGVTVKRWFDALNIDRIRVPTQETLYSNLVTTYENTYGRYRVMLNRWMPVHKAILVSTNRIKVVPLNGRSFHFDPAAKTGDSEKGMVLGEYTVEHKNEEGMAQITFSDADFSPASAARLLPAP